MSDLTTRFHALPAPGPVEELRLEPGTLRDYAALAEHHYRAAKPVTATRILALRHAAPTVVGRWVGRRDGSRVVAVLVESLPAISCALRDVALGGRYDGLGLRERARVVNREVRCVSRVVVDPRWRGLGLAVRLVRAALDEPATPITEALAAMGAAHPFFERAGMTRYDRPPHRHDARLLDALARAGVEPRDLVSTRRSLARIGALPPSRRDWLRHELRRWRRATTRTRAPAPAADADAHGHDADTLDLARRRLLSRPVYFVRVHG